MSPRNLVLAGGVLANVAFFVLAAAAVNDSAGQTAAGQPHFVNARVETRPAAGGAARALADAARPQASAVWIGYSVPAVPGDRHMCDSDRYPSRAYLEGRPASETIEDRDRAALEGDREIAILFRAEGGKIQKLRLFSIDCELDAGGLPVVWLTGVGAADSVAMLRDMVNGEQASASEVRQQSALMAIALHRDATAERAVEAFAAPGQPTAIRKRAAFWLGAARGDEGFQALRRLIAAEADPAFRRELVFPISLSRRTDATDLLIRLAREDASAVVRKQAMFWLGQKAGERTASTLATAAASDPDTEVKKSAVFGLSRMPNGEGVPRLIEVARSNQNPAVRRQAMFWLGQSNDPRALAFLEEILKQK